MRITKTQAAVRLILSFALFFLIGITNTEAQSRMTPLDSLQKFMRDSNAVIEARLVNLVLKNPQLERVDRQNRVSDYQLRAAKSQWVNLLSLSGNYNDRTFAKQNTAVPVVYPKFFFGFSLPLGTLLSRTNVRAAKEAVEIGKLSREELERKLKTEVLLQYHQYRAQSEVLAIETSYMNDLQAAFSQAEQNFRKNSITFEAYNTALKNKNDQQVKLINQRLQLDAVKLNLESLIDADLEAVIRGTVR